MVGTRVRRRWSYLAALAVLLAALFSLTRAEAVIAPSTFEASDGNLVVDTAGNKDWVNIGVSPVPDVASGSGDNSLSGAEDDTSIKVTLGSVQPNKSDLTNYRIARETVGGQDFLYLAWERVPDPSGNVNIDFELNQLSQGTVPTTDNTAWNLNRAAGDILITFELVNGGTTPQLAMLTWLTTAVPGGVTTNDCYGQANSTGPCWGGYKVLNPNSTPAAEASVRVQQNGDIDFGEASINLQGAGIFKTGVCTNFGSVYVKSRSSGSGFQSQLSDFIHPSEVSINNCGDLTIVKNTTGAAVGTFTFDVNCSNDAFDASNLSITTAANTGSTTIEDIPNGTTCTVTEDSPAPGWTPTSVSPAGGAVTIAGNKTVTFTNARNFGKIVVNKTATGGNGTFIFDVACTGMTTQTLTVVTTNGSGTAETPSNIPLPTDCTVTERTATGWSPAGQSTPKTVDEATETVSFTNTRNLGSITVVKNATGGDGTFVFDVACTGVAGYPKVLTVITTNGTGSASTGTADIPTGTPCTVTERTQAGTWTNTGTDSQPATPTDATRNVTVTFNNTRDMGSITVNKTASGGTGTFQFTVDCGNLAGYPRTLSITTGTTGSTSTPQDIPTGTDCTVTEVAQPGVWTIVGSDEQDVTVNGVGEEVDFENVRDTGAITINKTATGGNGTFQFVVTCPQVSGYPTTLSLTTTNGAGSVSTLKNIPTNTTCTVAEVAQPGTWTIVSAASQTVVVDSASESVSFSNSRDMGAITVTKTATGGNGTFTFTVACPTVTGYPVTLTVTTINGTGSASTAQNIPTGTDCTVTEGSQPGVWTIVGSAQQTVTVDSANENVVFSNARNVGSLTVVIKTEGGNGTFPYTVDCDGSPFDASGSVTTVSGTGSAPTIGSIPTGTTCTASQAAQPGWTLTSTSPQSVVIDGDEVITFVNVRNVNSISVDKSASVSSATEGDAVTFTYVVRAGGPDALSNVTVVDDKCSPVVYRTGDVDNDSLLDPSETWTYTCQAAANSSAPTNIATATGVDPAGAKVEATDKVTITVVAPQVVVRPVEVKGVQLPRTGSDIADLAMLGGSLMLLGFSVLFISRRRRTA